MSIELKPERHESPAGQASSVWQKIRQPERPPTSCTHNGATGPSTSGHDGSSVQSGKQTIPPSGAAHGPRSPMKGHSLGTLQSPYAPFGSMVEGPVLLSLELAPASAGPSEVDALVASAEFVSAEPPVELAVSCSPDEAAGSVECEVPSDSGVVVVALASEVEVVGFVTVVAWPCGNGSLGL